MTMAMAQGLQVNNLVINFGAWPATRSMTLLNLKGDIAKNKNSSNSQQPTGKKAQKSTS